MANITIGEDDFSSLFEAANLAQDTGRRTLALALDKLARKANAALSHARTGRELPRLPGRYVKKPSWQETPSTLTKSK